MCLPRFLRLLMELKQVAGWPRASRETWAPPWVRSSTVGRNVGYQQYAYDYLPADEPWIPAAMVDPDLTVHALNPSQDPDGGKISDIAAWGPISGELHAATLIGGVRSGGAVTATLDAPRGTSAPSSKTTRRSKPIIFVLRSHVDQVRDPRRRGRRLCRSPHRPGRNWPPTPPRSAEYAAAKATTLAVFDEVVTGFRVSPGGLQKVIGITPDMTTLAKILSGGLPGGAVVGRKDIFDLLDFAGDEGDGARRRSGIREHSTRTRCRRRRGSRRWRSCRRRTRARGANAYGTELRAKMNEVLEDEHVKWAVHGSYSGMHIYHQSGWRLTSCRRSSRRCRSASSDDQQALA